MKIVVCLKCMGTLCKYNGRLDFLRHSNVNDDICLILLSHVMSPTSNTLKSATNIDPQVFQQIQTWFVIRSAITWQVLLKLHTYCHMYVILYCVSARGQCPECGFVCILMGLLLYRWPLGSWSWWSVADIGSYLHYVSMHVKCPY